MPPPTTAVSNIRAFVQLREPSIYAGEELDCIIILKNIAPVPRPGGRGPNPNRPHANGLPTEAQNSHPPSATHSRRSSAAQRTFPASRATSVSNVNSLAQGRGHRPALSLNVVGASARAGPRSAPLRAGSRSNAVKDHGRSLSIISLGSEPAAKGRNATPITPTSVRPAKHSRSASMQAISNSPSSLGFGIVNAPLRGSSPLAESTTPLAMEEEPLPIRPARRRPGTQSADATPQLGRTNSARRGLSGVPLDSEFQFPSGPKAAKSSSANTQRPPVMRTPSTMHSGQQQRTMSPRPQEGRSGHISSLDPLSRVLSESSAAGTPRSSSEFYSRSNNSDETLTSEVPSHYHQNGRLSNRPPMPGHPPPRSSSFAQNRPAKPEVLMMGFVQTTGHFIIDGGLVNSAPFEEVKRKGVQGGGGVIGLERTKRSSGMFGAFSWGNIGESLGGLLGNDDMSSMAQMKATASSKSVPLLSTPQNLLFVDLTLAPGEQKHFRYRFLLPRGLPPSHKGKAIKVAYSLSLGIQRPEGQAVKLVEVPFRVLGSYNLRGETLGHDLMSPYILLTDSAKSQTVQANPSSKGPAFAGLWPLETAKNSSARPKQGLEDFLRYTERLTDPRKGSGDALVSPSANTSRKGSLVDSQPGSIKEAIDLAIIRANYLPAPRDGSRSQSQGGNRFNIARAGQPVAVVTLLRSAYRLGEIVTGTIDFTARPADSGPTTRAASYSVVAELESAERVDGTLALRSSGSTHRVTRRVHALARENTLFSRQMGISLSIPFHATPTFETTGVSLVWTLRIAFTTQRQGQSQGQGQGLGLGLDTSGQSQTSDPDLLEEIVRDERGTALIAKLRLLADTFDVAIPLQVYGAAGIDGLPAETGPLDI